MARTVRTSIDAVVTRIEVLWTAQEKAVNLYFIEQEQDEAGNVIRQDPERMVVLGGEDLDADSREILEDVAEMVKDHFLARRYS